ncbi:MAG TPA: HAMP domain-containing sensor histidine kinase [Puia sp.]|nr:HAMP domain-containing sensor histidine kinase [Puia sp.]
MTEISRISLENEMDIAVAHKHMESIAQYFSLLLSTRTAIATAVAEISRVVIDRTDNGWLSIGMERTSAGKFSLIGRVSFPPGIDIRMTHQGLKYARLLVPEFRFEERTEMSSIIVGIGVPRSLKVTPARVLEAVDFFQANQPVTPFEQLKLHQPLDEKKNEFISVVSHELKTPLTSLNAFTKLALGAAATESSETVQHYLEKIDHQTHKLQVLIQQLLDTSCIESGKLDYNMQQREWNGYVKDLFQVLEQMFPTHPISWQPCAGEVVVTMDVLRIEQVLINLVSNAAKYSAAEAPITIECVANGGSLTICVRDIGIGISRENLTRIFDKYFRDEIVEGKYSGFGMGLYITSGIIHEHHGTIWAENNKDTGSSFYFTLPITKPISA